MEVKGRLVYIEPNNIAAQKGVNFRNGDNISWSPEDLNIAVDLQVIIPERDNCGQYGVTDYYDVNVSATDDGVFRKWKSFMSGTNLNGTDANYLTDNYTDISYQEIHRNKAGGKESLGIQSIDINFDSHFFPIVTMNLVDVRGFSLMSPAEEEYLDVALRRKKTCENFFKALFHFPYPRFALSIKGFYGDRITFMLCPNDFKSKLNSQTGNFDVTIEFIGHMYGLYSDIPLNYLTIAPFIGSTNSRPNKYWETQTSPGGNFTFSDGVTSIPTLVEIAQKYDTLGDEFKKYIHSGTENANDILDIEKGNRLITSITRLINLYLEMVNSIGFGNNAVQFSDGVSTLYFLNSATISIPSNKAFMKSYNDYIKFSLDTEIEVPESISDANRWCQTDGEFFDMSAERPIVLENGTIDETHPYYDKIKNTQILSRINESIDTLKSKNVFLFVKEEEFLRKLETRRSEIEESQTEKISNSSAAIEEASKQVLGFNPTIENVFRIVFAHMDTFMHCFYDLLDTINRKRTGERLVKNFPISLEETDLASKGSENCFLPPFTGFFKDDKKDNKRVRKYPGEIPGLSILDEVNFVEQIYRGINGANTSNGTEEQVPGNMNDVNGSISEKKWEEFSLLDTGVTQNPYSGLGFNGSNETGMIETLLYFVACRIFAANMVHSGGNNTITEERLTREVNNLLEAKRATLQTSENFKKLLKQCAELNDNGETILTHINNFAGKYDQIKFIKKGNFIHLPLNNDEELNLVPMIFTSFVNKSEIITYGQMQKFSLLDENSKKNYTEIKNIPGVGNDALRLTPKYATSNRFVGRPYPISKTTKKIVEYKKYDLSKYAEGIRIDPDAYYTPLLQTFSKKHYAQNLYRADNDLGKKPMATIALACMCSFSDFYDFEKEGFSFIERMPKYYALFIGALIWRYNNHIIFNAPEGVDRKDIKVEDNFPFILSEDKCYTYFTGKPLLTIGGMTIEEIVNADKGNDWSFQKYFEDWVDSGGFSKLYKTDIDKDSLETDTNITKYEKQCLPKDSEISKELTKLFGETVDVLRINTVKKYGGRFNIDVLKTFCSILYNEISTDEDSRNEVEPTSTEGTTEYVANAGETSYERLLAKNQIYYTLKNLYDKWISTYNRNRFKLQRPDVDREVAYNKHHGLSSSNVNTTEFQNFMFIDTFYNDIKDRFLVDPYLVCELANSDANRSVLEGMSYLAQKSKMLFIALPVYNNLYNTETITKIFTPQNLYNGERNNGRGIGNTYVLMYTHEASHSLNLEDEGTNSVGYDNDSFDLADSYGCISEQASLLLNTSINNGDNYTIPAFGVTFAKQNQMYFKNISVSMETPRETDVSIANRLLLAKGEVDGSARNTPSTIGQDLFSIYSNRSYECSVDMMGCANIMPLMYFQLNNVPMFKGAYRIYTVKHHIENGVMSTSFTGIRISKNAVPFNDNVINVEALINKLLQGPNGDGIDTSFDYGEYTGGYGGTYNDETKEYSNVCGYDGKKIAERVDSDAVFNVVDAILAFKATSPKMNVGEIYSAKSIYQNYESLHVCATAVKIAVTTGFLGTELQNKWPSGCDGYKCRNKLPELNFKVIANDQKNPELKTQNERIAWCKKNVEPGDIAVMLQSKDAIGHICMYCGDNTWVSDFNQRSDLYVYNPSKPLSVIIFRYAGKRIMPKDYHKVYLSVSDELKGIKIEDVTNKISDVQDGYNYVCYDKTSVIFDVNIENMKITKFLVPRELRFSDLNVDARIVKEGENDISLSDVFKEKNEIEGQIEVDWGDGRFDGDLKIRIELK